MSLQFVPCTHAQSVIQNEALKARHHQVRALSIHLVDTEVYQLHDRCWSVVHVKTPAARLTYVFESMRGILSASPPRLTH
jgi:ribosomal silencing factor RsfS